MRLNIIPAIGIFDEVLAAESNKDVNISSEVVLTTKMHNQAIKVCPKSKFRQVDDLIYEYVHKDGHISKVNLEEKDCTCPDIVDRGICGHLIVAATMANLQLSSGLTIEKRLKVRYQKRSQVKGDSEESDFDISQTDDQPAEVEPATQYIEQEYDHANEQTQSVPSQDENELIIKPGYSKNGKKLGRKPKVSKALERDEPVGEKSTCQRVLRNKNR